MKAPEFEKLTPEEFAALVDRFEFRRRIDSVHMHHTWRPEQRDYDGLRTIQGMWRYHTETNGWRDIAQHVSIAPDGSIWLGRDWNSPPASAGGFNGTSAVGPFMFETIGNFDVGEDRLTPEQRGAVLMVIAKIWERFALPPTSLRFHRDMTTQKSCPGTGIAKPEIVAAAEEKLVELRATRRALNRAVRWGGMDALPAYGRADDLVRRLALSSRAVPEGEDGELEEGRTIAGARSRGSGLDATTVRALRPHVVTLRDGGFARTGELPTTKDDVDAIFDRHLVDWQRAHAGEPLRIMLWAHGGLNDEGVGLQIAQRQVAWWRDNGVYPIHFVWHTGFFDALDQLVFGPSERELRAERTRGIVPDRFYEAAARRLGIPAIWGAMKNSAALSSDATGGATHLAERLSEFCRKQTGHVELYAAGHSAGSIFHAFFLPAAFASQVPSFRELFLLAPAIRTDLFKQTIAPLLGRRIDRVTMFTMNETLELDDSVGPYDKSLLYMVSRALEGGSEEPILGLDASVRADADLMELFGLRGGAGRNAEVVWSDGRASNGTYPASTSRSHGGFDDDGPTMDSLVHRITGAPPVKPFPTASRAFAAATPPAASRSPAIGSAGGGRRLAFCVGIDDYPGQHALQGCVNDMRAWRGALDGLDFEVRSAENRAATRAAILGGLEELVGGSRPGDVLVFQYAGHGTHLDDIDGDEDDGQDEAFVPVDFESGAYLLDDDIWTVFSRLPAGVNLTCFIDCCHSGTITRVLLGPSSGSPAGARARFMRPTRDMQDRHRDFRRGRRAVRSASREVRDRQDMTNVVFSACRDDQVAYEVGGSGEFTSRAVPILGGTPGQMTHATFQAAVERAFGAAPRQMPRLDCPDRLLHLPLLAPFGEAVPDARPPVRGEHAGTNGHADLDRVAALLREAAGLLDGRR